MRPDDLEFLIAQYADGTLAPERIAEVESALQRSGEARRALDHYRSLDQALTSQQSPNVRWDRLEDRISRQVAALAAGSTTAIPEEVEEQIARLADGSLSAAETRLIEARISADPQARLLLSEYASLERIFEAARATPLPAVRWDALADHLARTLGIPQPKPQREEVVRTLPIRRQTTRAQETGVWGRVGTFFAAPRRLAIAACLLIAGTVGIRLISMGGGPGQTTTPAVAPMPTPGGSEIAVAPTPAPLPAPGITIIEVKGPGTGLAEVPSPDNNANAGNIQVGPPADGGGAFDRSTTADRTDDNSRGRLSIIAPDKSAVQDKDAKASRDSGLPFPR
jgi:anti-sigma factor RsiW